MSNDDRPFSTQTMAPKPDKNQPGKEPQPALPSKEGGADESSDPIEGPFLELQERFPQKIRNELESTD